VLLGQRVDEHRQRLQRHPDESTETFGSERLTGALLDRLTHHVTILEMNGDSYRLAQSRTRKTSANA
jgi:DNA replication protein DnaC